MHGVLAAGAASWYHEIELAEALLEHSRVMSVPTSTTTLLGVFVSVERTPVCYRTENIGQCEKEKESRNCITAEMTDKNLTR